MYGSHKIDPKKEEAIVRAFIDAAGGYSYILQMKHSSAFPGMYATDDQDFSFHPRYEMPCYGELRKYKATHGDLATKPENKPHDLACNFPVGEVYRVIISTWQFFETDEEQVVAEFLLSDKSPWRDGLDDVKIIRTDGKMRGFSTTGRIDSTTLVNLIWVLRRLPSLSESYYDAIELGATKGVAILISVWSSGQFAQGSWCDPSSYHHASKINVPAFVAGESKKLSGGLMVHGFDYDRKYIHDTFNFGSTKNLSQVVGASGWGESKIDKKGVVEKVMAIAYPEKADEVETGQKEMTVGQKRYFKKIQSEVAELGLESFKYKGDIYGTKTGLKWVDVDSVSPMPDPAQLQQGVAA